MSNRDLVDQLLTRAGYPVVASADAELFYGEWDHPESDPIPGSLHLCAMPASEKRDAHMRLLFADSHQMERPRVILSDSFCFEFNIIESDTRPGLEAFFVYFDEHPTAPIDQIGRACFATDAEFSELVFERFVPLGDPPPDW